jgi:hypothetical protein
MPNQNKQQFGVSPIADHDHSGNGYSGPKINYKNLLNLPKVTVYTGIVSPTGTAGIVFPSGWTVVRSNTNPNVYDITHNLGLTKLNYTVNATITTDQGGVSLAFGGAGAQVVTPLGANKFQVMPTYFTNGTGTSLAAEFFFTMNVVT